MSLFKARMTSLRDKLEEAELAQKAEEIFAKEELERSETDSKSEKKKIKK